jgi:hypothetical protein
LYFLGVSQKLLLHRGLAQLFGNSLSALAFQEYPHL